MKTKVLGLIALMSVAACSHHPHESAQVSNEAETAEVEVSDEEYNRIPASDCHNPKYVDCKEARRSDVATSYMLDSNRTLYRRINNVDCAITSNVQDFKISQHPNDVAVLYFRKDGHLHMINVDKEQRTQGQCPSVKNNTKVLMENVTKYTVTSNVYTTIVNAALDKNQLVVAWDNVKPVYKEQNVDEFQMNNCYGQQGKSFSSYVMFTRSRGEVTKVKVNASGKFIKDSSAQDPKSYSSIQEFKQKNKVCK